MTHKQLYRHVDDVRRMAEFIDEPRTPDDVDCRVSANVGEIMAAALAAAGSYAIVVGGRTPCETDYLAARGATFPKDVTREEMEAFNRMTLREEMDEAAERARYAAIAGFFHGRATV